MAKTHVSAHTVSVHVRRPIEEVFDYLTTAANWPRWHPATVSVSGAVDHPALEGEVIVEKVKHGPLRDTFAWEVVERRAPHHWAIRAASERHGQKVKIIYTLSEEEGGTRWEREMRFYFPSWFAPLDRLLAARILRKNSETAVRQLKELMEYF
ncbi:MAG: hypothetical protein HPY75_11110 [Actinobacteria bacterium]|nr:hypothetical protein [Actinomycetota bacterium]